MGMYNAIIPDELLQPTGVYKERLSQSALYYETTQVSDEEARGGAAVDGREGDEVRHRAERGDRPDGPADSLAVQDVYRRRADRRRFRLQPDRHPVSAGAEGSAAGQRPGRRDAQQRRPPAGPQPRRPAGAVRRAAGRSLQRGGRVRGPGRADDLPRARGDGPAGRKHAARRALGRRGPLGHGRGLRVGVPDQRLGAAGPFCRRLEGGQQRTAAGHVLPPGRRDAEGHLEAGRDRLVADFRRERAA